MDASTIAEKINAATTVEELDALQIELDKLRRPVFPSIEEGSYRRGFQHGIVVVYEALKEVGWDHAKKVLECAANISGEMRFDGVIHPDYMERLRQDVLGCVRKPVVIGTLADRLQNEGMTA